MSEVQGIDVSHYQGAIDWKKVVFAGKKFAIMKCQYESLPHRIDEQFEANYSGCEKYGIKRGVYIYIARASMSDVEGDANALLRHLKGRKLEYGIWLDMEDGSLASTGKAYIRDLAYRYAKVFKAAGYYVGIYTNKAWYNTLIHDDLKRDFDIWFARYPKNDVGEYKPNSSLRPSSEIAVAWQYSSKGKVSGIKGNVDLDVDFDGVIDLNTPAENVQNITLGNPYREPASNMKEGMSGNAIKWIQYQLNLFGYGLKEDGIFGINTKKAVMDFQSKHKDSNGKPLEVDGIVGLLTRTALKEK